MTPPPPGTALSPEATAAEPELVNATWGGDVQSRKEQVALALFIIVPLVAGREVPKAGVLGRLTGAITYLVLGAG